MNSVVQKITLNIELVYEKDLCFFDLSTYFDIDFVCCELHHHNASYYRRQV